MQLTMKMLMQAAGEDASSVMQLRLHRCNSRFVETQNARNTGATAVCLASSLFCLDGMRQPVIPLVQWQIN